MSETGTREAVPAHVEATWRLSRALYARRRLALPAGLALLGAAFLLSGVTAVRSGETGLRRRLGRLVDGRVPPGLAFAAPLVGSVTRVPTGRVLQLVLARRDGAPLELLTADENLVSVKAQVQYRVEDAGAFRLAHRDAERVLRAAASAALAEEVGGTPVEALLTTGKGPLQEAVRRRVQASLEQAGTGLRVVGVSVVSVGPPPGAEDAFNAVSTASAERERRVSEAEGRRSETMALSRAEAERTAREASSSRLERVEEARGAQARFRALAREIAVAREAGFAGLHRETLTRVLARARLVALPPRGGVEAIRTVLGPAGRQGGAASPEAAAPGSPLLPSDGAGTKRFPVPPIVPENLVPKRVPPESAPGPQ